MIDRFNLSRRGFPTRLSHGRERAGARWGLRARPPLGAGGAGSRGSVWGIKVIWVVVMAVGLVALIAGAGRILVRWVSESDWFELREFRTVGVERVDPEKLIAPLRGYRGSSLFRLDLAGLKGRLMAEPWVAEVSVRREYPDAVWIHIVERRPAAIVAGREIEAMVDDQGAVISEWPRGRTDGTAAPSDPAPLPVLHGLEPRSFRKLDPRARERLASALDLIRQAPIPVGAGLHLDVASDRELQVQWEGYRVRFGPAPYSDSWRRFLSIEGEIRRRHPVVREVDLRFGHRVIVR